MQREPTSRREVHWATVLTKCCVESGELDGNYISPIGDGFLRDGDELSVCLEARSGLQIYGNSIED